MQRFSVVLLAMAMIFVAACEPTVDASSEESFKASIQEIKNSLPEDKRKDFEGAVMTVALGEANFGAMMAGLQDENTILKSAKEKLDGKTAEEIFAAAEKIEERREKERAKREAKRRAEQLEQAKKDIAELEKEKARSQEAQSQLAKFEVTNSKFYKQRRRFGRPQPIIELEVVNNTDTAVSRAYFEGTYATPGRSVPWIEEEFNYNISGGLEPGESAQWSLAPNMFSDWGDVEEKDDAVFTVEVTRLDGPDGEAAYDVAFGDDDAKRLEKLKERVAELSGQ